MNIESIHIPVTEQYLFISHFLISSWLIFPILNFRSVDWSIAQLSLLKSYSSSLSSYLIPCYVASGACEKPGMVGYE